MGSNETTTKKMQCDPHPGFHIDAVTTHIAGSNLYYTDIKMHCSACGVAMAFRGPWGLNSSHPTIRPDGSEVTLPAVPMGETLRSDKPLASYSITDRSGATDA